MEPISIIYVEGNNTELLHQYVDIDKVNGFHYVFQVMKGKDITQVFLRFMLNRGYEIDLSEEDCIRFKHKDYTPFDPLLTMIFKK